jgi:hypothetical protein
MSDQPLTTITIQLPRTITGSELIAAVKAVCEEYTDRKFYSKKQPLRKKYLIGQASIWPYRNVLVGPSQNDKVVRSDRHYDQVVVMSHIWPVGVSTRVSYGEAEVVSTVSQFSEALKRHLMGE